MTAKDEKFQAFKSDWIKKNSMKRGKMVPVEGVRGKYLKEFDGLKTGTSKIRVKK